MKTKNNIQSSLEDATDKLKLVIDGSELKVVEYTSLSKAPLKT